MNRPISAPRALIGCERSGIIREEFRRLGWDAWSCDLEPSEDRSPFHWQGDLLQLLENTRHDPEFWPPFDLMIAHPECRFLSSSGLHWNKRRPEREEQTRAALEFAAALWNAPIPRIALENPVGALSRILGKPSQSVQPFEFGEDASKRTCLWLKGLPILRPTGFIEPRLICRDCGARNKYAAAASGCASCGAEAGRLAPRWANQTDSGQNRLSPSAARSMDRARTYRGLARAMAEQWTAALFPGISQ